MIFVMKQTFCFTLQATTTYHNRTMSYNPEIVAQRIAELYRQLDACPPSDTDLIADIRLEILFWVEWLGG